MQFDQCESLTQIDEIFQEWVGQLASQLAAGFGLGLDHFVRADLTEDFGMDRCGRAADDAGNLQLLLGNGGRQQCRFEVFPDGDDQDVDLVDFLAAEGTFIGGVEGHGHVDTMLDFIDQFTVGINGNHLRSAGGQLLDNSHSKPSQSNDGDPTHDNPFRQVAVIEKGREAQTSHPFSVSI